MIVYFDTSALVKLLVEEDRSDIAANAWIAADVAVASRLALVETRAALAAAARDRRLTAVALREAKRHLSQTLAASLTLVDPGADIIDHAGDLAEQEGLRGYDAVHLATALAAGVTLMATDDSALAAAAQRQGLHVTVAA